MFGILYKYACRSKTALQAICRCRKWWWETERSGIHHRETETQPQSGVPRLPGPAEPKEEALSKKGRRRQVVRRQAETARQAQGQTGDPTIQDEPAQGEPAQGEPAQGEPAQGEPAQGGTPTTPTTPTTTPTTPTTPTVGKPAPQQGQAPGGGVPPALQKQVAALAPAAKKQLAGMLKQ